jgi:tetratricopeptide (TPR) repeat protein
LPPLRPNFEGLTYFNPSAVLTMVALFAIPTAALVDWNTHRGRLFLGVVLAVVAVVAFLSGSRAGWFAIGLTIIVMTVLAVAQRDRRLALLGAVRGLLGKPRVRLGIALFLAAVVVGGIAFGPGILRRINEGGDQARLQYAVSAVRMFAESPLFGTGPGTWVIQRQRYTYAGEPDVSIPHAHDVPAQTIAEQGGLGALAGIIVLLALLRLIREGLRDPDPMRSRVAWATMAGLAYFGFHQLLDFYANMPAALFAAAVPLAYLDATRLTRAAPDAAGPARAVRDRALPASGPLVRAVAGVILVASVAALLVQEVPALLNARAASLADRGAWAEADDLARQAADADIDVNAYAMTAGLTAAHAGDHQDAAAYFRRVAERDDLSEAWVDLAAEELTLGDLSGARQALQKASRLGLQQPGLAMAIAGVALQLGLQDVAVQSIVAAISGNPTIAADPWWDASDDRRGALNEAIDRLLAADSTAAARWQLTLMAGRASEARQWATRDADPRFSTLVVDAWSGDASAFNDLIRECIATPLDENRLGWCARTSAHIGDENKSIEMRRLLEVLGPGSSGRSLLRIGDASSGAPAGNLARYWGTFTYRRATPADMLVPGLVHLALE